MGEWEIGRTGELCERDIHHTHHIRTTHKRQKRGVSIMHIWSAGRVSLPHLHVEHGKAAHGRGLGIKVDRTVTVQKTGRKTGRQIGRQKGRKEYEGGGGGEKNEETKDEKNDRTMSVYIPIPMCIQDTLNYDMRSIVHLLTRTPSQSGR